MIALDRVKVCANPDCREVLPADRAYPEDAGFYVDGRREDGSARAFKSRCKECSRLAKRGGRPTFTSRVYRAVVDGAERQVKWCPECDQVKVAEDSPESGFYVNRIRGTVTFYRFCKTCTAEKRRVARRTDPRFKEMERAARARWVARNPERSAEMRRDWQRRWRREHREEHRELQRLCYRLRAERKGVKAYAGRKVIDGTRPEIPAAPFIEWLTAYQQAQKLEIAALAQELGLVERRVRYLLTVGQASISVDVVSRALTEARVVVSAGGRTVVTFDDLYSGERLRERRRKQ